MTLRIWRSLLAGVAAVTLVVFSPAALAAEPFNAKQWGFHRVGAGEAWSAGKGAGVTIAVIDSGVDLTHPDLRDSIVPGYDFIDRDARPQDGHGHGTHVAGIAAARPNTKAGVAGIAPQAKIMPVRVLDDRGRGSGRTVEDGVRWAVDNGADVINLSLADNVVIEGLSGGTLTDIVNYAWSKGVVPVIAAGNGGLFRTDSSNAKTLVVTATTNEDRKAYYATSVGFAPWGLAAPGGDDADGEPSMIYSTLWSPQKGSGYGWAMGTSMSAPHVAGAAAILRGLGLDAQQTVDRILSTARDIGASGRDFTYGHGRLDVAAAVEGVGPRAQSSPPKRDPAQPAAVEEPATAPPAETAAPSAVDRPAPSEPRTPGGSAAEPTRAPASASPSPRIEAFGRDDDSSGRWALANIVLGLTLLGAAGALVGYSGLRKVRAR